MRPVQTKDIDTLFGFAKQAAPGILSLPKSRELLEEKVELSVASFAKKVSSPQGEYYLFVLENLQTGAVGGCSGIYAQAGFYEPLYFYRMDEEQRSSDKVKVKENQILLQPLKVNHGPSELCSLYLDRPLRKEGIGSFLSLTRLLFIGSERQRFQKKIMARIRGFITESHTSPFWDHLGRHFFDTDFIALMKLLEKSTDFIPSILPKHPIYLSTLAKVAINVVGKPHPNSRPAIKMLKGEGFEKNNTIDPFDAGPTVEADLENIGVIKRLVHRKVQEIEPMEGGHNRFIIAKGEGKDFRAIIGTLRRFREQKEDVIVDQQSADALGIKSGEMIITSPAHQRNH
jgi:arginine N-succinyltransferase